MSLPAQLPLVIFCLFSTVPEAATGLYPNSTFNFKNLKKKRKKKEDFYGCDFYGRKNGKVSILNARMKEKNAVVVF